MPLDFTYARRSGQEVVTVFLSGQEPRVVDSAHPHFPAIWEALQVEGHKGLTDQEIYDLADVEKGIALRFQRLSERVTVRDRTVFFDGDPVDNALTKQMLRVMADGGDLSALVAFYEKVMTNPLEHSRQHLYRWVDRNAITIVSEGEHKGDIIGYKGGKIRNGVMYSTTSGRAIVDGEVIEGPIPYAIGSIVEMPRSKVAHTPSAPCGTGLHVGTYTFAKGFSEGLITVRINPRDVVNVPEADKIRVCRLVVLSSGREEIKRSTAPVVTPPAPKPVVPIEQVAHTPTDAEWDGMWSRAKTRRQNFKKYASTTGGWEFVGADDDDFKDRKFWTVPAVEPPVEEPQEAAQEPTEGQGEGVWVAGTWVPDQPSVADRSTLFPADKVRITAEAQDRGIDWEPTWPEIEEDDPADRRAVADFGVWQVISDNEEKSLFAGDSGQLTAEVVGAAQFGNERVAFHFTPEGMDMGWEVLPFEDVEPLPKEQSAYHTQAFATASEHPEEELEPQTHEDAIEDTPEVSPAAAVVGLAAYPDVRPEGREPSQMEFMKMQGRAKVRRQNFRKYASTTGGWTWVGPEDGDPKWRGNWKITS